MAPVRIGMLTTFYPPYNFGGDGIGVQRMARALSRRGFQVTVVHDADAYNALSPGPEPTPRDAGDGVEVVTLRSRLGTLSPLLVQQTGRPVIHAARLRELVAGFDVVHFNNVSLVGGPGLLAYGSGVKVYEAHEHWLVCPTHVLWRHGREPCDARECTRCVLRARRPPQLWRYTGALERALAHVDVFIAKSDFSRRKHHEFGFPREMEVLPYFLPDADAGAEAAPPAPRPHPYFLFVGRLERIKGLDDVIPAFAGEEGPELLIAGSGDYEAELRRQAEGLPRVVFLGRVEPEKLRAYYAHADALIVPSVCYETFGIILIEAFRQGTPVIARRIGPLPEIVEAAGGGLLFGDAAELRAAMDRVRDAATRSALSASAREAFQHHWSESAVVPRYLELVARAAESRGRRDIIRRMNVRSVA